MGVWQLEQVVTLGSVPEFSGIPGFCDMAIFYEYLSGVL